jgi:virginiamycin B lyase
MRSLVSRLGSFGRRMTMCVVIGGGLLGWSASAASALAPPRIYWSTGSNIAEANLDMSQANTNFITGGSPTVAAVAVDGQHVYWMNGGTPGTIGRANLDGTAVSQNFITGVNQSGAVADGIAVNDQHIYWTNSGNNTIGEANLDGTGVNQSFITGANAPAGVVVDGQHIYWANSGNGTIGRANLDGSGVNQTFITLSASSIPTGVTVDGQHIYWTDGGNGSVGAANLDGSGVTLSLIPNVAGQASSGVLMAVDEQHIYWDDFGLALWSSTLDGGSTAGPLGSPHIYGVAVSVPSLSVSPASPAGFSTTPQGTASPPQVLTLTNNGQQALFINGLTLAGANPGDFAITSNGCLRSVAPSESCQLTVSFAPQGQGARSASLQIFSSDFANSPFQVPLSGVGGQLPQGPQGTNGSNGAPGQTGQVGPNGTPGPAGQIELVTCKTVTQRKGKKSVKRQVCSGRLVTGKVSFTTGSERDTLSRGGVVYATGSSVSSAADRAGLTLVPLRRLGPGRYTLTRRVRRGPRWVTRRSDITIR